MRAVRLTAEQARRLWQIRHSECEALLQFLVDSGLRIVRISGAFRHRFTGDPLSERPLAAFDSEAGVGPAGSDTATEAGWAWVQGNYTSIIDAFSALDDGEYGAAMDVPAAPGEYDFAWRFSTGEGLSWVRMVRIRDVFHPRFTDDPLSELRGASSTA